MQLNEQELGAVLAGLQLLADFKNRKPSDLELIAEIASDGGRFRQLGEDEVVELAEELRARGPDAEEADETAAPLSIENALSLDYLRDMMEEELRATIAAANQVDKGRFDLLRAFTLIMRGKTEALTGILNLIEEREAAPTTATTTLNFPGHVTKEAQEYVEDAMRQNIERGINRAHTIFPPRGR